MSVKTLRLALIFTFLPLYNLLAQTECDISNIYEGSEVSQNIKVFSVDEEITELDDLVELILEETNLDAGYYEVSVTRKGKNLYRVDGLNIYIETRYCYEYSHGEDVLLHVESSYGYSKGEITWP